MSGVRGVSKARLMRQNSEKTLEFRHKFEELVNKTLDEQTEFFMKSFIFALGDNWREVSQLATRFAKYLDEQHETKDLDPVAASDFLQRNGKTRTATERRTELEDMDLDKNGRIGLTEYFLLHYKSMVLSEYFKRHEMEPTVDLSNDCVGVTGVGNELLEELFTMPAGLDPEIEAAIEEFMNKKREKETKVKTLEAKAAEGGVKGLAAKNELAQIEAADTTDDNRVEITLQAAKRRAAKYSAAEALDKKKKQEEATIQQKRRDSRAALAARAAMFESGGSAPEESVGAGAPVGGGGGAPRPPPVPRRDNAKPAAPARGDHACSSFDVDLLAAEFAMCKCGFKKSEHV